VALPKVSTTVACAPVSADEVISAAKAAMAPAEIRRFISIAPAFLWVRKARQVLYKTCDGIIEILVHDRDFLAFYQARMAVAITTPSAWFLRPDGYCSSASCSRTRSSWSISRSILSAVEI
jgi:hypothetical protein